MAQPDEILAEGIKTAWDASAAITAVFSTRPLRRGRVDPNTARPYAQLKIAPGESIELASAAVGGTQERLGNWVVTIDVYADSDTAAASAAAVVGTLLNKESNFALVGGTLLSINPKPDDTQQQPEQVQNADVWKASVIREALVQYSVAV